MGSFIGQTDYENQQMQFSFLETRLQEQLTEAREDCRQKGPMYRRIGFFGGAIAALGREILYYRTSEHAAGPGHHQNPALYIKKILCHIIM